MTHVALTIAGSDPSGGAGLQADLKAFHRHHVYGMAVVTLLTVQNTRGVRRVETLEPGLVDEQIDAVVSDIPPDAAKTGALGSAAIIEIVAERAEAFDFPLVVDPVMISKHGDALIDENAIAALTAALLPRASLVTPNRHEAAKLAHLRSVDDEAAMMDAASTIADLGPRAVLIKGVPAGKGGGRIIDLLYSEGAFHRFETQRIDTTSTHGTGCAYSAAITAHLARGCGVVDAVTRARAFITEAIRSAPALGGGFGPTNFLAPAGLDECVGTE